MVEWINKEREIREEIVNNMRLIPAKVGKEKVMRIVSIFIERLKDLEGSAVEENTEFRVKYNPVIYENQKDYIDENTGFRISPRPIQKSPLLKELNTKVTELRKALEKNKEIKIRFACSPLIKVDEDEEGNETRTTYYKMYEKDLSSLEIL